MECLRGWKVCSYIFIPVVVALVRIGTHVQSLTLRTNIAANPLSTPFDQILSWLCQRRDYFTAASIALSLLDDADAVYELCRIPEVELSHHKGMLDGIQSLPNDTSHGNETETLTYLADMTVSCLIKGAAASVLEGFLSRVRASAYFLWILNKACELTITLSFRINSTVHLTRVSCLLE
jgi:hypothetical protein